MGMKSMTTLKLLKHFAFAGTLMLCTSVQGQEFHSNITPAHGTDTFSFALSTDSVVTLVSTLSGQLTAGDSGFGIKSADQSTDVVRPGFAHPGMTEGPWPLQAGTYYLKLYSVCGCTGGYSVQLNVKPTSKANDPEPNDSAANAVALPFGTQATGYLGYYNGLNQDFSDTYAINLATEGKIAVTSSHDLNGVFGLQVLQGDASTEVRDTSLPLPSGKYYIKAYTNSLFTYGGYTLSVNFTPTVPETLPQVTNGVVMVSTPVVSPNEVNPTLIIAPAAAERHGSYQLYVAALYGNQLYFLTLQDFQKQVVPYRGGEPPVYQTANGAELYNDQANGGFAAQTWYIGLGDLSGLSGLQLFAGFGRSGADMLNRGQVTHIYTIP